MKRQGRRHILRRVAGWAFGSSPRVAAITYLVLTLALGAYAFVWGGLGAGDLVPGAVFILLTAPVSVPAFALLPASWINTEAIFLALAFLAPFGTVAIVRMGWFGWRWVGSAWKRRILKAGRHG